MGKVKIPLYTTSVQAGFPSPADDFVEKHLDLNEHLVKRPEATFFVRVRGESMLGAGIYDGDILVVDRSCSISPRNIIIAALDGELTVKRLLKEDGKIILSPENPLYEPITVTPESDFLVWGRVKHAIRSF